MTAFLTSALITFFIINTLYVSMNYSKYIREDMFHHVFTILNNDRSS